MAAAFVTVVTATVTLIMDLIGKVGGTPDFSTWNPGGVSVGAWITSVISFVILAAVVYYLIVTPYNQLQKRRLRGEEEPEAPAEDIALLTEIRDILAAQRGAGSAGTTPRDR
jgi:large conductance mechanosensitive channel